MLFRSKMSGGRGVRLHPDSSVRSSEYFIAIELTEGRDLSETLVFQAVGIPSEVFEKVFGEQAEFVKKMEWDEEKKRFYVLECREWRSLSMGGEHKRPASLEEIEGRLAELAAARFTWISNDNAELACWLARIRLLHKIGRAHV